MGGGAAVGGGVAAGGIASGWRGGGAWGGCEGDGCPCGARGEGEGIHAVAAAGPGVITSGEVGGAAAAPPLLQGEARGESRDPLLTPPPPGWG